MTLCSSSSSVSSSSSESLNSVEGVHPPISEKKLIRYFCVHRFMSYTVLLQDLTGLLGGRFPEISSSPISSSNWKKKKRFVKIKNKDSPM